VRADRLLAILLMLQARGRMTASDLAEELEVSVRTIYRDIESLGAAGVPVYTESGPGGGCQLLEGWRSPFSALTAEEATALLQLGVPEPLRELGAADALRGAQGRIRRAAGLAADSVRPLVHLDMPRWFHSREAVPHLGAVADAVRSGRRLVITHRRAEDRRAGSRTVDPLGLVNKAGVWYLVASTSRGRTATFRVGRITGARVLDDSFERPPDFDLASYWEAWSEEFEASRPRIDVTVRASPMALRILPEILGDAVRPALASAGPPDGGGWRTFTLTFEHAGAATHRLAGFGDLLEVLSPAAVRHRLLATARGILSRYSSGSGTGRSGVL